MLVLFLGAAVIGFACAKIFPNRTASLFITIMLGMLWALLCIFVGAV